MTRLTLSSAALWLGASALNAHAAPPLLAHGPGAPRGHAARAGRAREPSRPAAHQPLREVDGLRLTDGTVVRFPPHMADALTTAVKVGDTVRIIGRSEAGGAVKADAIVNTATGQTVYDQPPEPGRARPMPPHLRMAGLQTQQAQGRIEAVLTGPRGDANGVILSDGAIVRFALMRCSSRCSRGSCLPPAWARATRTAPRWRPSAWVPACRTCSRCTTARADATARSPGPGGFLPLPGFLLPCCPALPLSPNPPCPQDRPRPAAADLQRLHDLRLVRAPEVREPASVPRHPGELADRAGRVLLRRACQPARP